ncbi:amino acid adenylation domain-containing protein [Paenibacillus sp. SI8]|uniref:non-ribosomal peptide synthetase n=1 Tax=unclassified Paenibacillus TaxID=185978 RepID=UPI00346537A2
MANKNSLEARKSQLTEEKRALLSKLLKGSANAPVPMTKMEIEHRPDDKRSPLSYAQQRLWFFSTLEPLSPLYHLVYGVKLYGPLHKEALEQSLQSIVERHDILRTVFRDEGGHAYQFVLETVTVPLKLEDLRSLSPSEQELSIHAHIDRLKKPFDLQEGPLLRASLLALAGEEHVLLLAFHHLITDGWSHHRFGRELLEFYQAYRHNKAKQLPALRIQYADYAKWQRERLQEEAFQEQVSYWKKKLAGAPALLQLPTDYPRPSEQRYTGKKVRFAVQMPLAERLIRFAGEEQATPFMLLMAAFQTLLHRYSGEEDLCVGTAISGRNHRDVEPLIGFFVNTLVIRSQVTPELSFRQLMRQVRKDALDAYAHQDVPFELLVDETVGQRSISYSPLFQVMFTLQNTPAVPLELSGLTAEPLEVETGTSKFDLTLEMVRVEAGWEGSLEYNQSLFEEATVQRMTEHFVVLLASIADTPDAPLQTLCLLSSEERELLLDSWSRAEPAKEHSHPFPADTTLDRIVARQAGQQPELPAVVDGNRVLTYGELISRAECLASRLRRLGVQPGTVTAICMERSLELVTAQLAILLTGGAYLPIDPATPNERIAYIVTDSQAPLILTQGHLQSRFAAMEIVTIVADVVEDSSPQTFDLTQDDTLTETMLANQESADTIAYVIYTSGSTGQPKGTLIPHKSIVNFMSWYRETSALSFSDRVCFASGIGFDLSVAEIFGALVAGASLWIPPEDTRLQPELLRDWMLDNKITFAFLPTPLAEQLISVPWPLQTPLRRLFTGGDKWNAKLPQGLPFTVYDLYGPTECTIACTYRIIDADRRETHQPPHIGRPISNARIYILDRCLNPVPIGVPGELMIGGHVVGSGYLRRDALTREKFIRNPFTSQEGELLYRSGDTARYLPDGRIQYLGRSDEQVKIRGFRVELHEIQTVLTIQPSVKEAVVIVREDAPGDKRITAYLVAEAGLSPDIESLRQRLKELLPAYMIPSAFVTLERLPLTSNGKIDRGALPKPDTIQAFRDMFEEPRNPVEQKLCDIWAELLVLDKVGIHQNYFEIGGDSIKTMMFVSRAKQAGLTVIPKHVFQYQTIAELSQVVSSGHPADEVRSETTCASDTWGIQAIRDSTESPERHSTAFDFPLSRLNRNDLASVPGIHPEEIEDVYPLTPLQDYMLATLRQRPEPAQFFVNMVMHFKDRLDPVLMTQAWQLVANHFAITKTSIADEGLEEPMQVTRRNVQVPIHYHDWRGWSPDRQQEALKSYQDRQLIASDLTYIRRPTTYEVMFATIGDNDHQLVMSCSYLLMDGWSHFIVLIHVLKCYYNLLEGKSYELPPVRNYGQYAAWLRTRDLGEPREYWGKELEDFRTATPLIQHAPFNKEPRENGFAKQAVEIELAVPQLVQEFAGRNRVTVNVLFQLVWTLLLARYTGQRDVLFGVMSTGRQAEYEGAEELVGPAINTLPLRIRLDEDESVPKLLRRIQEKQLLLTEWDYTPLRGIREWIGIAENKPLFESYMIFQNLQSFFETTSGIEWVARLPVENEYHKALAIFDSGTPLRIDVCSEPGGYQIFMTYLKAYFRDESVGQMLADLKETFLDLIQAPEQAVGTWINKSMP